MRTIKGVSAGLDLIQKQAKQNPQLGKFLDELDRLDELGGVDHVAQSKEILRPYSGRELTTTERWKD